MGTQTVGEKSARPAVAPLDARRVEVDELTDASRRWFVLTSLGCRIALTIPAVLLNRGLLGAWGDRLLPLTLSVIFLDGLLILVALRRPSVLTSWWLFVTDMTVTVAVTFSATLLIAPNTFLVAGHDALTGYGWGTVVLWAALWGWRTGVCLVVATPLLQLAMAGVNHCVLDAAAVDNLVLRTGIAVTNLVIATVIVGLAVRGARQVVAEGIRAGRLAERADALRHYHDTALAELDAMVLTARSDPRPSTRRLTAISARAAYLARAWRRDDARDPDLDRALAHLVAEFAARNLRVALLGKVSTDDPHGQPEVAAAAVGAVREALNNVAKHAGVRAATVTVGATADLVEIEIRDRGAGFVPTTRRGFGLQNSIVGRIADLGGTASVVSTPGVGTLVRVALPRRPTAPPPAAERSLVHSVLTWFLVVPVIFRLIALPMVDFMVGPFIPHHALALHVVTAALMVAHGALLAVQLRYGADRPLRSRGVLVLDLAIAAALYLWTAAAVAPGTVVLPGPDGAWLYILGTVPLWIAACGRRLGGGVLAGSILLEALAIGVNGGTGVGNAMLVLQHVAMVVVVAAYAMLIMHRARIGADAAMIASLRAGRQRERIDVLTALRSRVLATLDAIGASAPSTDPAQRLDEVTRLATAAADDLRAVLRDDSAAADNRLVARLAALAADMRRAGLAVTTVVTELIGEPPFRVTDVVVAAVQDSLGDLAARAPGATVTMRVSGGPSEVDVTMRDACGQLTVRPHSVAALRSIAGQVTTVRSSYAIRTSLRWSAAA